MDDYTAEADKLFVEVDHLERVLDEPELALSVAKKVRRTSTLLVRAIARTRDQLQSQEDTSE